jgi:signal transduction histidine kinase
VPERVRFRMSTYNHAFIETSVTLASDQNNAAQLSPTARRMLDLKEVVLAAWEGQVRTRIASAATLRHPILMNTLPVYYDNIVQSISPGYPRVAAGDGTTLASEHGGERARITSYDYSALIEEYQILRWAIFEVLHQQHVGLDHQETHAIHASIDIAIQQAIEAFSLVHSGFRERFAAALTHDLRSPLGATMTALELILKLDDAARMKEIATRALANTRTISGMVDELLDTMAFHGAKQMQVHLSQADMLDIVREIRANTAPIPGREMRWIECPPVQGWWDRDSLRRAIENLIGNAVKYGDPGTPITVTIATGHERVMVAVHNEGSPIPPDEEECIFQMYRRATAANAGVKQGWGIGLPYVRAVAESHGGSVGLDSSRERGTTFTIDIPVDGRLYHDAPTLADEGG